MSGYDGAPFWPIKSEIFTIWLLRGKPFYPSLGFSSLLFIIYCPSLPCPFYLFFPPPPPSFSLFLHFFLLFLSHIFFFIVPTPSAFPLIFTYVYVQCMVLYIHYTQVKTLAKYLFCFFSKMALIPKSRGLFAYYTYGEIQTAVSCQHFNIGLNLKHVKPHHIS